MDLLAGLSFNFFLLIILGFTRKGVNMSLESFDLAEIKKFIQDNPDKEIDMGNCISTDGNSCHCLVVEFAKQKFPDAMRIHAGFEKCVIDGKCYDIPREVTDYIYATFLNENTLVKLKEVTL